MEDLEVGDIVTFRSEGNTIGLEPRLPYVIGFKDETAIPIRLDSLTKNNGLNTQYFWVSESELPFLIVLIKAKDLKVSAFDHTSS